MSDLISRRAAIEAFMTATADGDKVDFCIDVLRGVPTIDPVKHGRWIKADLDNFFVCCSWCKENNNPGRMAYRQDYAYTLCYCPNCGAKMKGEEDYAD